MFWFRCLIIFGLSSFTDVVVLAGLCASTQDKQATSAPIKLLLDATDVTNGMPNGFNFSLVNVTDHYVELPNPTVECSDLFNGFVMLYLKYTPSHGSAPMTGGGCAGDRFAECPSIIERVKTWRTLGPVEALVLKAECDQLGVPIIKTGQVRILGIVRTAVGERRGQGTPAWQWD